MHKMVNGFAIGLVLYHPEQGLFERTKLISKLGYRLFVFDNSPGRETINFFQNNPNAFYLTAGKNVGLGFSLSTLCATAYAHGYEKLLFLDQDTAITEQTLDYISNFITETPINTQEKYAALVFRGEKNDENEIRDTFFAISSGSLFLLKILERIGWHNESYFVDCVDYELCLRAKYKGYKIGLVDNTPGFDHITEQPDRALSLFGKTVLVRQYPLSRIKDAIFAYKRLMMYCLRIRRLNYLCYIFKSFSIYINGQIIARLIPVRK